MKLYIQIENNQPINHPAFEDNLMLAFGAIPAQWEEFIRPERPTLGTYQLFQSDVPTYEKVNGVWTDVWAIRDMTAQEVASKQQAVKDAWNSMTDHANFDAWSFDDATCTYQAPEPRPTSGDYFWQGATNSWQVCPPYPTDGKPYTLDFDSATWVEVTI